MLLVKQSVQLKAKEDMIIYNVTANVDKEVALEWKAWMKEELLPEVMALGYFEEYKFLRLLNEEEENPGITYALQFHCESPTLLNQYIQDKVPVFQQKMDERYKGRYVLFRTLLKEE